jgi:hypothetical protein
LNSQVQDKLKAKPDTITKTRLPENPPVKKDTASSRILPGLTPVIDTTPGIKADSLNISRPPDSVIQSPIIPDSLKAGEKGKDFRPFRKLRDLFKSNKKPAGPY